MLRRIISGFGSNLFGQLVTILIQILSLPIFLYYWDMSTYGSWLVLSALPSFLSMADVGMVQAAGNKMTMAMGRGEVAEANRIFQSADGHGARLRSPRDSVDPPRSAWPAS